MKNLTEIKLGKWAQIQEFSSCLDRKIKRRLLDLGFTQGQRICVLKKSMLGQAFLVELRGYCLTVRKNIALSIRVKQEG